MDHDYTVPGWRVWRLATPETPQQLLSSNGPHQLSSEQGALLKPLVASVEAVVVSDEPTNLDEKVVLKTPQKEDANVRASRDLVIRLKWDYVAYAVVFLIFLYMLYQFSYMNSRILILETVLAASRVARKM